MKSKRLDRFDMVSKVFKIRTEGKNIWMEKFESLKKQNILKSEKPTISKVHKLKTNRKMEW